MYEDDPDEWEKDLFDSGIAVGDEMKELFYELKEVGKFDCYQEVKNKLVKLAIDDDEVVREIDELVDRLSKLLLEIVSLQSRLSEEVVAHMVKEEDTCSDDESGQEECINESEYGDSEIETQSELVDDTEEEEFCEENRENDFEFKDDNFGDKETTNPESEVSMYEVETDTDGCEEYVEEEMREIQHDELKELRRDLKELDGPSIHK